MKLFLVLVAFLYMNTFARYTPGIYKDFVYTRNFNDYSGKIVDEVTLSSQSKKKLIY